MILLAVTADTWIVTGLGFGIVLILLFCLVYILQFFGWIMQKATAPKEAKGERQMVKESDSVESDAAAIAYALYLATQDVQHDAPTAMISLKARETAWNTKSIGLN